MIPPRLARHFSNYSGTFSPFTYSVGLEAPVSDSLASFRDFPLTHPVTSAAYEQLDRSLTFLHEAAHLAQYTSCAFGLRTLRRTVIAHRYLMEGNGWKLPVASSLWSRVEELSQHEKLAMVRFLAFLDAADQLRLHVGSDRERPGTSSIGLDWQPWSPYFFGFGPDASRFADEVAPQLRRIGALVHRVPHIHTRDGEGTHEVVLNTAALMENFALLVELNQMVNALGTRFEMEDLPAFGPEYRVALELGLASGACTVGTLLPTMAVCIDIALMYDPFVLFDSPSIEVPKDDRPPDRYPGETFVLACEAAREIDPVRSNEPAEIDRFYRALCARMGLPSPDWMAEKAATTAAEIMARNADILDSAWLMKAFRLHEAALSYRLERPTTLAFGLLSSQSIFDLLDLSVPYLSYFSLHTREPESDIGRSIDLLTVHNLIWQALSGTRVVCPLKQGEPLFCASALMDAGTMCAGPGAVACLVSEFERSAGLEPA